jgi:hypothetical protein
MPKVKLGSNDMKRTSNLQRRYEEMLSAIEGEALKAGINNLIEKGLTDSETEIRIWVGFGVAYPRAFDLEYSATRARASHIAPRRTTDNLADNGSAVSLSITPLDDPVSGWDELSRFLKKQGIDDPFQLSLDENQVVDPDGESIVVELKRGRKYNMVFYSLDTNSPDGERAVQVCRRLEREFSVSMTCGDSASTQ